MTKLTDHAVQTWESNDILNAFESLMWRLDKHDNLRSAVCGVEVIDGQLGEDDIRRVCNHMLHHAPRLSQRLVTAMPLTNPVWQIDPAFSLDNHLLVSDVGGSVDIDKVFDMAAEFAMADFNKAHSPWQILYVSNVKNNQSALIFKLHHAMSDGIGITQLLAIMHSELPEQVDEFTPPNANSGPLSALTTLRRAVLSNDNLRKQIDLSKRLAKTTPSFTRARTAIARYIASLSRVLAPTDAVRSPLLEARNNQWQFDGFSLPLAAMKSAAKHRDAKLNDIFIAGILRGFWLYHKAAGVDHPAVPVTIPVNIRPQSQHGGGNHFVPLQLAGPLTGDTSQLIAQVNKQVQRKREEVALAAPMYLMPLLNLLPDGVVAQQMAQQLSANDIQMSNVPGAPVKPTLAGKQVTAMYPFAPLPGCAAMISLVSIGDECFVGLNLDSAAITDKALLKRHIQQGFNDIFNDDSNVRPLESTAKQSTVNEKATADNKRKRAG